jgi:acyl-CoA thioesterase FadM
MWRAAGLSIAPPHADIGWPRVAASFEFLKPLRFEDEFEVHLRIAAKSKKTIRYHAVLSTPGVVLAVGSLTVICVRKQPGETMRVTDIPAEIDSRFAIAPPEEVASSAVSPPTAT